MKINLNYYAQRNERRLFISLLFMSLTVHFIFVVITYPDCWVLKKGGLSKSSLKRFASWGIAVNGLSMTAQASASRSRENESTLQDVLESIVPEKYWLSEKATRKIAGKLNS